MVRIFCLPLFFLLVWCSAANAADFCQRPDPKSPYGVTYRELNTLNEFNQKNYYHGDIKRIGSTGNNSWRSRYYIAEKSGFNIIDTVIDTKNSTIRFTEYGHVKQIWEAKYDYKDGNFWYDGTLVGGGYAFSGCVALPKAHVP